MVGDVADSGSSVPANLEPDKCEGWEWTSWANNQAFFDEAALFRTLEDVRGIGFNPFSESALGALVQSPDDALPPYCCCILAEQSSGDVLLEERDSNAEVAAGKLTCFGGKREKGEAALACIRRELREELGHTPVATFSKAQVASGSGGAACSGDEGLRRAVDLYVDGKLIAWFFEAAAPARDAKLVYEEGRGGLWLGDEDIGSKDSEVWQRVSPWHRVVLEAWKRGERRADFVSNS